MKDPATHNIPTSLKLWGRAREIIPGGSQLITRRPLIFASGVAPIYAERGKGSRIFDVDGVEYIDYGMSVTSCILGYTDAVVDDAVVEQVAKGATYSLNSPREIELAELLINRIPCAEMVRFAKGGGEACAIAVRIARGTTGRDKVLFCGYHGWHDWYIAASLRRNDALNDYALPGIAATGVPQALKDTIFPFPFEDLDMLRKLLEEHRGEVACIIMEPMRSNWPTSGYLEAVRELATRENVVLIFDEVTTNFRHGPNGLQDVLNVVPDVAVYAKAISNGYAMGAVVGKRWVLEPAARMFVSSTYWSDLIGITAAITTLHEIERRDVPGKLKAFGERLQSGMQEVLDEVGVPLEINGLPQVPTFTFTSPQDPGEIKKRNVLVAQEMAKRGVLCNTAPHHSAAHSDADLGITLEAFRGALTVARDAIHQDNVDEVLEASVQPEILTRMVR